MCVYIYTSPLDAVFQFSMSLMAGKFVYSK